MIPSNNLNKQIKLGRVNEHSMRFKNCSSNIGNTPNPNCKQQIQEVSVGHSIHTDHKQNKKTKLLITVIKNKIRISFQSY